MATRLQAAAGRVRDQVLRNIVTVTGRVGHIYSLGFDFVVGNEADGTALVGEAKRRRSFLAAEAQRALLQIWRIGQEYDRTPVLGFTLTEAVPTFLPTNRGKRRVTREWVVLPLEYAAELLKYRRVVAAASRDNPHVAKDLQWYIDLLDAADNAEGEDDDDAATH